MSTRNLALGGLALLVAVVGAFVIGNVVGDDSGEVETLEAELAESRRDLDAAKEDLDDADAELDAAREERDNLADQLSAEQDLSGELPSSSSAAGGEVPEADYVLGAAGKVGPFTMNPSLAKVSEDEGVARWLATIVAKNNGSSPVELFCGGSGAELIDSEGRSFDGDSVLFENSANCGDALQPGLTIDNYKMEFSLPADAAPAVLVLGAGEYGEGPFKSWAVSG